MSFRGVRSGEGDRAVRALMLIHMHAHTISSTFSIYVFINDGIWFTFISLMPKKLPAALEFADSDMHHLLFMLYTYI